MKHLQRVVITVVCAALTLFGAAGVEAATNQASFDIAGSTPVLSNIVTINTTNLSLVKGAYLTSDGTAIADGSTLPAGTLVDFLIYVDNTTAVAINNANIADTLDTVTFAYQANTIRVSNALPTGSTAAAILADVKALAPVSDAVAAGDVAGISGAVISAGAAAGNDQLDIAASTVWAMVFTVRLQ